MTAGFIRGVAVIAIGTDGACTKCHFFPRCGITTKEEEAAGFKSCFEGHHYELVQTTEQKAGAIADSFNAILAELDLTTHSSVLRILQSKLGQRRTAAIFKPK